MLYIRPSKKETSFSSRLFLKEQGGPCYLLFINFFLLVSKMAAMSKMFNVVD